MKNYHTNLLDLYIQKNAKFLVQDEEYYYLYKHFALDAEMKTLGIFHNNNLRYSYPSDFNDPYDCLCSIELDFSEFKKESFEKFAKIRINSSVWIQRKNEFLIAVKKQFNSAAYMEGLRKFIRVTCFNNAPLNILMWSHYANHHKGFMLEFRFKKSDGIEQLPIPVFYQEDLPKQSIPWNMNSLQQDNEIMTESIIKQFLTKSSDWSYENEFRQISDSGEFKKFPPSSLSSVVLGTKISKVDQEAIRNAVDNFNQKNSQEVNVYQASTLQDRFKLHVEQHPRLSH